MKRRFRGFLFAALMLIASFANADNPCQLDCACWDSEWRAGKCYFVMDNGGCYVIKCM
jgi:hypothetical protein